MMKVERAPLIKARIKFRASSWGA